MNVYDFTVLNQKGEEVSLKEYEGKVLLIVNTATKCGFTPQYEALEAMYEELKDQGFEILDFPCNQFLHQAPGSDEEINQFCALKYDTKFTRFKKIEVKGDNAIPLYKWLITQNEKGKAKNIKWNFTKFLINRQGEVVERFGSMDKPEKFIDKVREELKK
ncbi:MAG: glutathione peroxidase [Acholeplasmatales bacterium]|nr:glutathione peroxidase [Acholeplasmatales bacterium]